MLDRLIWWMFLSRTQTILPRFCRDEPKLAAELGIRLIRESFGHNPVLCAMILHTAKVEVMRVAEMAMAGSAVEEGEVCH